MKKTFTLLLASASASFAASPVNLNWTGNVADISETTFTGGKATFVLTLDLDAIQAWVDASDKSNEKLGYLSGYNSLGSAGNPLTTEIGLILQAQTDSLLIQPWRYNENYSSQTSGGHSYQGTTTTLPLPETIDNKSYSYATLVFTVETSNNNSKATGYMFYFDDKLNMVGQSTSAQKTLGSTFLNNMPYRSFTINTNYVNPNYVALYDGVVANSLEAAEVAKAVLPIGSIPEPTTTTLSLLALAGLAARRRRK